MLPALSLRNVLLVFFIFSFVLFQVYILLLQRASILQSQGLTSSLIEDFVSGAPQVVAPSSMDSTTTSSTNAGNTTQCIPFNVDLDFEPTTRYRESTTMPQWMKGACGEPTEGWFRPPWFRFRFWFHTD